MIQRQCFGGGIVPNLFDWDDPHIAEHKRDEYHKILRAIPPGRKLEAAFEMNGIERNLIAAGIRALYPEASDRQVTEKLAWLFLPDELWEKAYGPGSAWANKEQ